MNLGPFTYIFIVFVFLFLPTAFVWFQNYNKLIKNLDIILLVTTLSILVGFFWESYALKVGIWKFFPETTFGIFFYSMPLEEYLFMTLAAFGLSSFTIAFMDKKKLKNA